MFKTDSDRNLGYQQGLPVHETNNTGCISSRGRGCGAQNRHLPLFDSPPQAKLSFIPASSSTQAIKAGNPCNSNIGTPRSRLITWLHLWQLLNQSRKSRTCRDCSQCSPHFPLSVKSPVEEGGKNTPSAVGNLKKHEIQEKAWNSESNPSMLCIPCFDLKDHADEEPRWGYVIDWERVLWQSSGGGVCRRQCSQALKSWIVL